MKELEQRIIPKEEQDKFGRLQPKTREYLMAVEISQSNDFSPITREAMGKIKWPLLDALHPLEKREMADYVRERNEERLKRKGGQ